MDLDGTLLRTDALVESLLVLLRANPFRVFLLPFWMLRGKAAFKLRVAAHARPDVSALPYNEPFLAWLREQHAQGRRLILATAAEEGTARAVADHLGLFSDVVATTADVNCSGRRKLEALVAACGEGGFDYAGNGRVDLRIFPHARGAVVVAAPRSVEQAATAAGNVLRVFREAHSPFWLWLRALRIHQALKNLLVFVPLFAAHQHLDPGAAWMAGLGFLAFSLCAGSVYLLNDLLDLEADRHHPRKRERPFAAGQLPLLHGVAAVPLLLVPALAIALALPPAFLAALAGYYALTLAYSLRLKQVRWLDVTLLAALFTLRIVAGAAAIAVVISPWLLALSMCLFLSLAMVKRYTELDSVADAGGEEARGRGYHTRDRRMLGILGPWFGYLSAAVLGFYIGTAAAIADYARPVALWLLCAILAWWVHHMWQAARRGQMHDDPLVHAVRDVRSAIAVVLGSAVWLVAL